MGGKFFSVSQSLSAFLPMCPCVRVILQIILADCRVRGQRLSKPGVAYKPAVLNWTLVEGGS